MGQVHSQLFSSNATEKQLSNSERGIILWEEEWRVSVFIKIVVPLWCGNETLKLAIKQADIRVRFPQYKDQAADILITYSYTHIKILYQLYSFQIGQFRILTVGLDLAWNEG